MTLPSYLGLCPYCGARVALAARTCAGAHEEDEGSVTGVVIIGD